MHAANSASCRSLTRCMLRAPLRVDRLTGRTWIAAAQGGADLGWVAGEVLADDVQAELAQDRGGRLAFEKELERGPDEFPGGDVTAAQVGGKSGRHAHLVAGARGGQDAERAIGLAGGGGVGHAGTLAAGQGTHRWLAGGRRRCRRAALAG